MTEKEAKKRIEKLKKLINYHRYLYHVLDRQEISTDALDSLKHELYLLEKKYPQFITPDSPTQRIGGKPLKKFKKHIHQVAMLSMEDIFSEKELKDWIEYLKKFLPYEKWSYFCEPKIDGLAISLIYKDGIFNKGATRGDGRVGEDVSENLKTIESIPLRLEIHKRGGKIPHLEIKEKLKKAIKKGIVEIRGEVYIEKKEFEKLNEKLKKEGKPLFANPRNLAAGSIRQLDPKLTASRPLKFLAYDIVTDLGQKLHSQEHQILTILGFKTDPGKICQNEEEIISYFKEIAKKRKNFPFEIDGVVIQVNENEIFKKLGVVGKSPRAIRAFKFALKQGITILKEIRYQVGRTGAITPVAILKPTKIGGVTITRASLHNKEQLEKLDIRIGDTVIVGRAGDVIPEIIKPLKELRTGKEKKPKFPKKCPICGFSLIKEKEEAIWRCPNKNCPAKKKEFLYHFVSKKAFDIEGLGPKIIDQLIKEGLISQPEEIFQLQEGDLIPLERFAEKSASNLISSIRKSKKISLSRFIVSLGIRFVGEETANDLANHFTCLEKLMKAKKEELLKIENIGEKVATSIYKFFKDKRNRKMIENLLKAKIEIIPPKKIKKKLKGLTFVFSGALKSMTREEAKKRVRFLGGSSSSSVSKETDFLVVGENPGSKYEKAKKLGIKIIEEKDFLKMIK